MSSSTSLSNIPLPGFTTWHNNASPETRLQFARLTSGMPGKLVKDENGLFHLVTNKTDYVINKDDNESIEENKPDSTMILCSKLALVMLGSIAISIIGSILISKFMLFIINRV